MAFAVRPVFRVRPIGVRVAAVITTLSVAGTANTVHPSFAVADDSVPGLINQITSQETALQSLDLQIGALSEEVNKALVDLHDSQAFAEQARQGAVEARKRLDETQKDIEQLQDEIGELSRQAIRNGGAGDPLSIVSGADARAKAMEKQQFVRRQAEEKNAKLQTLQDARTDAANEESLLRHSSRLAEERATEAQEAQESAQAQLDATVAELETQLDQRDAAIAELEATQAKLEEQRPEAAPSLNDEDTTVQQPQQPQTPAAAPETPESEASDADAPASEVPVTEVPVAEGAAAEQQLTAEEAPASEEKQPEGPHVEPAPAPKVEGEPAELLETLTDAASDPEVQKAAADAIAAVVGENQPEHQTLENPYTPVSENTETTEATDSDANASASASSDAPAQDSENAEALAASDNAETDTAETDTAESDTVETEPAPEIASPSAPAEETEADEVLPEVMDAAAATEEIRKDAPQGTREEQIEAVIARAESQIGVPYAWGGGNANGPTKGIRDGGVADRHGDYDKTGFDCSGLVLYSYAGAGIDLPHYTGYQYQRGTQIPVSEAQRGDLLFWGPTGNQHVAIYLGDGMMLEAPQSGQTVQKTKVRYSGMAPYAVRMID